LNYHPLTKIKMKFENLEKFSEASMINRMKWLREAPSNDVATAIKFNQNFAIEVEKTIGKQSIKSLSKYPIGNYEEALQRLILIEFEPSGLIIKELPKV